MLPWVLWHTKALTSIMSVSHEDGDEEGREQQGPEAHRHGHDDGLGTHGVGILVPYPMVEMVSRLYYTRTRRQNSQHR